MSKNYQLVLNEFMGEDALYINKGNNGHLKYIPYLRNTLLIASNILKLTACTKCTLLPLSEKVYQTNWLINLTYYGISYVLTFL